jgi:hypothetical protein
MTNTFIIPAETYSDDHLYGCHFDAVEWFEAASDEEIKALARIDWGGNRESDEIAYWYEYRIDEIQLMFDYCSRTHRRRQPIGFECHVDEDKALLWLREHRPVLHHAIVQPSFSA